MLIRHTYSLILDRAEFMIRKELHFCLSEIVMNILGRASDIILIIVHAADDRYPDDNIRRNL